MSAFNKLFNKRAIVDVYTEIAEHNLMQLKLNKDRTLCDFKLNINTPGISPTVRNLLTNLHIFKQEAHMVESFMLSQMLVSPKIFQPSQLDCETMEQIALNIPLSEYRQPFPTMIIEFPENYTLKRMVDCPQQGSSLIGNVEKHTPVLVSIYFEEDTKILICCVYFSTCQCINRFFWHQPNKPIEDILLKSLDLENYPDSLDISREEETVTINAIRLGINACLMLMEYGCKSIGPQNKSYVERLSKHIDKARKARNFEKVRKDERELRGIPTYYDFAQVVKLHDTYNEYSSSETASQEHKKSPKPHWRKGHWRMQPHGTNNELRKRILIKPVLVNSALLGNKKIITIYNK